MALEVLDVTRRTRYEQYTFFTCVLLKGLNGFRCVIYGSAYAVNELGCYTVVTAVTTKHGSLHMKIAIV
jgi:hypothetical protein